MKHCILVKFLPEITDEEKNSYVKPIKELFEKSLTINGIQKVNIFQCCIPFANRADLMIEMQMEQDALEKFDSSHIHAEWKAQFGKLLASKTIFDYVE